MADIAFSCLHYETAKGVDLRKAYVVRIENRAGKGPYNPGGPPYPVVPKGEFHYAKFLWSHPTPDLDEGINRRMSADEICGFTDAAQAIDWFTGYFDELAKCGYVLATYEVDPEFMVGGKTQAIFLKDNAKKISEIPTSLLATQ